MKLKLICILPILFSIMAFGQDYKIEGDFKIDKPYHFTVKRAKFDSREPVTKDLAQLTEVEANFTQKDIGLVCVWKYGETKVDGPENVIEQFGSQYNDLFNLYKGYEIEILFEPITGEISLLNYNKMKENIKNGFIKVFNHQMTNVDSSSIAMINKHLEPTYSTPEQLLANYFPEIDLYFNLYAQKLTKGVILLSESYYPNPLGESFPVSGEIEIESIQDDLIIIKQTDLADQQELNRILKDMVNDITDIGGSNDNNEEEMPIFMLNAESRYSYDQKRKIITKVQLERKIEVTGFSQIDILEVKLIE